MKKIFGLLIVAVGIIQCTMAQDSDGKGFDKSKLFVGGNLGLAFGTYTIVNVSPLVGYHFSNVLAAGVGLIILIMVMMMDFILPNNLMWV